jgi:hypothetical protein
MTVEHQVNADFERARRKAFWRSVLSWLTGRSNDLLPFEAVRTQLRAHVQSGRGFQEVPLDHIIGSVGRYRDFDSAFLPRQTKTRDRWLNINRAHYRDISLPAVELYQVGDVYFVRDGNHRVSVARERGQEYVDAEVTKVQAPAPIHSAEDVFDWLRRQDELDFLERTGLGELGEGARIELTLPGQYEKLLEHIDAHRWYLGIARGADVPYSEAVQSWYDRVYTPLVQAIRATDVLREFPGRTEADLYLWIIEHLWYLREAGVLREDQALEYVVRGYMEEYGRRPFTRLRRALRHGARQLVPPRRSDGGASTRASANEAATDTSAAEASSAETPAASTAP